MSMIPPINGAIPLVEPTTPTNSPSTQNISQRSSGLTRSYSHLLKAVEGQLETGDEDSMNELKQRIQKFTDAYLQNSAEKKATDTNEFSEPLDSSFVEFVKHIAELKTSPEAIKLRDALAPLVRVRRNLLEEFHQPS